MDIREEYKIKKQKNKRQFMTPLIKNIQFVRTEFKILTANTENTKLYVFFV